MKRIYFMRHGIAEMGHATQNDAERALTTEGIHVLKSQINGIKKRDVSPDLILTSPLKRAKQTAEIIGKGLNPLLLKSLIITKALVPNENPEELIKTIQEYNRFESLFIVGHQPLLGYVVSLLEKKNREYVDFGKGSLCLMEFKNFPGKKEGELKWLITSKQLISEGD